MGIAAFTGVQIASNTVDLHEKYTQKTRIKFYTNKNFPLRFQKFAFIFSCIFVCIF